jgi:hypothetical protein
MLKDVAVLLDQVATGSTYKTRETPIVALIVMRPRGTNRPRFAIADLQSNFARNGGMRLLGPRSLNSQIVQKSGFWLTSGRWRRAVPSGSSR